MNGTAPPASEPEVFRLEEITVGDRDREDLGDIEALAESIRTVGLLHPIVVTVDGDLVAGDRRMAAVRHLGWSEVPVTVVDLSTAEQVLRAESDENTCRKSLTPVEAAKARERRARILAPKAKARQDEGREKAHASRRGDDVGSSKLEEPRKNRAAETRAVGSIGTGYSPSTLDKVDRIRSAAEQGTIREGREDKPVPEPVREAARSALSAVSKTGAVVDREHKRLQAALDEHVEADPNIKQAKYRKRLSDAFGQLVNLLTFDAETAAAALDAEDWPIHQNEIDAVTAWWQRVKSHGPDAQPSGLRVVGGNDE